MKVNEMAGGDETLILIPLIMIIVLVISSLVCYQFFDKPTRWERDWTNDMV